MGWAGYGMGPFFAAGFGISVKIMTGYGMEKYGGIRDAAFFYGEIRETPKINGGMRDEKI